MLLPILKTKKKIFAIHLSIDTELWYSDDKGWRFTHLLAISMVKKLNENNEPVEYKGVDIIFLFGVIGLAIARRT